MRYMAAWLDRWWLFCSEIKLAAYKLWLDMYRIELELATVVGVS